MLSGAFRTVLHFVILVFARRSVLLVRRWCALCLFTLGGADPIVLSCASLQFVVLICALLRTTFFVRRVLFVPFLLRHHLLVSRRVRFVWLEFCYACFGRRVVCGRAFVFWLSVALWCRWRRWFVAVHSKQVGSLAPVLCVHFCVATRCVVVACLVFSLCALHCHAHAHSKDKTWGWGAGWGFKVRAPMGVVVARVGKV